MGEKLLAGNPHEVVIQGFATSLQQHSNYLIEHSKWADILVMYKKILALKPNQQQALQGLLGLGANLFDQKKWEESITVSRALLEIKPDPDIAWLIITRCSTFQAISPSNWRSDRPSNRFTKMHKVCAKTFRAIRLVKCQRSRARIFSK